MYASIFPGFLMDCEWEITMGAENITFISLNMRQRFIKLVGHTNRKL